MQIAPSLAHLAWWLTPVPRPAPGPGTSNAQRHLGTPSSPPFPVGLSWLYDWRNRRDQNRSSRTVEERSAARIGITENPEDGRGPGKLNGKATTLQEKRGLSRYGERYKEKGRDDWRWGGRDKGIRHGEHYEGRENKGERGTGALRRKGKQSGTRHGKHYVRRKPKGDTVRGPLERGGGNGATTILGRNKTNRRAIEDRRRVVNEYDEKLKARNREGENRKKRISRVFDPEEGKKEREQGEK
ncbi:hypothetical protein NDU88_003156 [Pleurodeles waltl]|uniref:Uncharacterized protein n=1 Tax=Pleurodeles waltl TaxID=8319 RepID=A0AAV7P8U5_PLEWA|nr:hypothetical protein NDU88_003156 [Pleurodeles waltl]